VRVSFTMFMFIWRWLSSVELIHTNKCSEEKADRAMTLEVSAQSFILSYRLLMDCCTVHWKTSEVKRV